MLTACSNGSSNKNDKEATKNYKQDSGKTIKVPKKPKRIVVLGATYAGGLKPLPLYHFYY